MDAHLSPTNVATYYHNQCQLYLHNSYHRSGGVVATSSKAGPPAVSPLTVAQYQRGLDWEERLFHNLELRDQLVNINNPEEPKSAAEVRNIILQAATKDNDNGNVGGDGDEEDNERNDDEDSSISTKYIANLTFMSPSFDRELQQYGSPPNSVAFGLAKPDLVKVTTYKDKIVWEIIDAKASNTLKTSHTAQIGFYHICLENLLSTAADEAATKVSEISTYKIVPSEQASIWLPNPKDMDDLLAPVPTPVSLLLQSLRTFLFKTLPQILQLPRDQIEWHLNPSCHGCEFWERCKSETISEKRLGLIPNLSVSEGRFIREVLGIAEDAGILDKNRKNKNAEIEDLDQLVKSPSFTRLEKEYPATIKRFQKLMKVQKTHTRRWSPALEAAATRKPQVTIFPLLIFPSAVSLPFI